MKKFVSFIIAFLILISADLHAASSSLTQTTKIIPKIPVQPIVRSTRFERSFVLFLKYEKDKFVKDQLTVMPVFPTQNQKRDGKYIAYLLDKRGRMIAGKYFDVSTEQTICPESYWFDRLTGEQKYVPSKEEVQKQKALMKDTPYVSLVLPFNTNAGSIMIVDSKTRKVLLNIDVTFLTSVK